MPENTVAIDKTPHHEFRVRGELEQQHHDIEPLPPTPITDDARERLESWGIPVAYIERLQQMASSFRYDLSPLKTKRIASRSGYIGQAGDDSTFVALPCFHDIGTRLDGTCGDISVQLLKLMHSSGYMGELNKALIESGSRQLAPCFVMGSSSHFNNEGAIHVWTGLVPQGESADNMVIIDGSFQQITTKQSDEYRIKNHLADPTEIDNYEVSEVVPVGSYYIRPDESLAVSFPFSKTLGISQDRKFVYGLTFVRNGRSGKIDPAIQLIPQDEREISPVCLLGPDGNLKWEIQHPGVLEDHIKELKEMLMSLQSLQLVEDHKKAYELANDKTSIKLR